MWYNSGVIEATQPGIEITKVVENFLRSGKVDFGGTLFVVSESVPTLPNVYRIVDMTRRGLPTPKIAFDFTKVILPKKDAFFEWLRENRANEMKGTLVRNVGKTENGIPNWTVSIRTTDRRGKQVQFTHPAEEIKTPGGSEYIFRFSDRQPETQ